MTGKKALLARCLAASRVLPLVSRLRSWYIGDVPILAYHRVWDITDEDRFEYDVELISASVAEFAWQMNYLRENHTPITFARLGRILDGDESCPQRPVIVTFDDGFEDNYRNAFPVLRDLGVPATLFVSTDYIGKPKTYWFDHVSHLLLTTQIKSISVQGLDSPLGLSDAASRRDSARRLLEHLKRVPDTLRLDILAEFDDKLSGSAEQSASAESGTMTWDQVREMAAAGIEIGSHTVSHPILANVADEALRFELAESKRVIESQINQLVTVLSYPIGKTFAFDDRVCEMAQSAGYRFAATLLPGTNRLNDLNHLRLCRMAVERYTDRANFAGALSLPELLA